MNFIRGTIFLITIFFVSLQAETPFTWGEEYIMARRLELIQEAQQQTQQTEQASAAEMGSGQKSVGKAVLFSALVPGSGQFYSKSYIKAGIFLAAEISAWVVNISYNQKGDDKDAEFKAYANENWDERRYWSFLNWEASEKDPDYNAFPYEEQTALNGGTWYLIPEDYYNSNRENIIGTLREVERELHTHQLPSTRTQQYYEMIGKYPMQFGYAWSDASFDRSYSAPDNITPNNDFYMDMREDSNRLYNIAQYGAMAALVNHVIAAIDAGFTTRNYNRRHARIEMSYDNYLYKGEYLNMLGIDVKW
ncbi:MAG: hypothetical protein EH225_01345 [Calditrichaeota bacterium]|nr:MAG: hypothetical protein EH225_01345 [Calditrichota bacterium]